MRTAKSTAFDASLDVDTVQAVVREHPVRLAILFGSSATGTTHGASDIDLAVEFDEHRPSDPSYNDVFLGLNADLSEALETDDVDVVDVHTVSPSLAASIFERGVLLAGTQELATELRHTLAERASDQQSPGKRLDAALARIDDHLGEGENWVSTHVETEVASQGKTPNEAVARATEAARLHSDSHSVGNDEHQREMLDRYDIDPDDVDEDIDSPDGIP